MKFIVLVTMFFITACEVIPALVVNSFSHTPTQIEKSIDNLKKSVKIEALSKKNIELLDSYCKVTPDATIIRYQMCNAVVNVVLGSNFPEISKLSFSQKGILAVDKSIKISETHIKLWREAIELKSSEKSPYTVLFDGGEVTTFISELLSKTGIKDNMSSLENSLKEETKKNKDKSHIDFLIAVHSMIDLALSPRGSLLDYQQQLQQLQTQWESAKTLYLLEENL
jgi:hypothetical protein